MHWRSQGGAHAGGGEYGGAPYPVTYQVPGAPALRTSPPPLVHTPDGPRPARALGGEVRACSARHVRNSSSPAGMYEAPRNTSWASPPPPPRTAGAGRGVAPLSSPHGRSHALPQRTPAPTRVATEAQRIPSPPLQGMRSASGISRPFSSGSLHSQSSSSSNEPAPPRVLIQATLDNEHFSVVDVSGLETAPAIKACILRKLQISTQDLGQWGLVRTEIGFADLDHAPLIDDDTLLALCLQLGDDKGTMKFLVQRRAPGRFLGAAPSPARSPAPASAPPPRSADLRSPRVRGATAPPPVSARPPAAPWPMQKAATSVPRSAPYAPPSVHEAIALGQWPVPQTPWHAPPAARDDPYVHAVYPASSNQQVAQFQLMAPHNAGLQPGMTVQTVLGAASPVPPKLGPERTLSHEAPASLQPANPALRQMHSPPAASPSSMQRSLTRSPLAESMLEFGEEPPGYEQAVRSTPPATHACAPPPVRERRPSLPRTVSSPLDSSFQPVQLLRTGSEGMVSGEDHCSVYPLFKSDEQPDVPTAPDAPDIREAEHRRPLPMLPSPLSASASPSSARTQDSSVPSHFDLAHRMSWGRERNSSGTAPTSVATSQSDVDEEERLASVQRLMMQMRVAEERKADTAAGATFESFSDDTLGGTFAQSLDASTLRDTDTLRAADRTVQMPSAEAAAAGANAHRPVLTLSISPQTAAQNTDEMPPHDRPRPERASSFTHDGQQWAFRPEPEQLYEQLDTLFPRHDLDKPLSDATNAAPAASLPARANAMSKSAPKLTRGLARNQHHSIRVIAQNRKRLLESTPHVAHRRAPRDQPALDRRRSTKLWGGRMVEMRTNEPASVGLIPDSTTGPEVEPSTRPEFKWVKGDLIGKGTYGRVYLALNATTGEMIAVKQVDLPRTNADRDSSRQRGVVNALRSEIETLKDLDHPNVVTCLGFEQTSDTLSIFLEYVPGGSIGSCLRKHGKFDENTVSSFLNQILEGLAYLHRQGILHRDLKADNLLVDFRGNCKISDFGTVRRSDDIYNNVENMSLQGSIFWMAPEVMSLSRKGYSAKVDIWSLGCVVLEMLAGRRPWSDEEAVHAMFKIGAERRAPPVPPDCKPSKPAAHFLRNCFEIDPDRRPTAARLLEHVFAWPSPDYCFEHSALYQALHRNSVD